MDSLARQHYSLTIREVHIRHTLHHIKGLALTGRSKLGRAVILHFTFHWFGTGSLQPFTQLPFLEKGIWGTKLLPENNRKGFGKEV